MKPFVTLLAAASLGLGALALAGCSASDWQAPAGHRATTAGGNGEFGENPAQPGSYQGEQDHPNLQSAPGAQPANRYQ